MEDWYVFFLCSKSKHDLGGVVLGIEVAYWGTLGLLNSVCPSILLPATSLDLGSAVAQW